MKHAYRAFLVAFLLFLRLASYGQQAEKTVTVSFAHVRFEQFVSQVEAQTNYRFYYDPVTVDSLFVTVQAQAQPLQAVLYQALQATDFRFAIDDENRVFVSD